MSNTNMKLDAVMVGKYCIIRGKDFGVFAGTVETVEGDRVLLKNARRLWYWDGAASLSQLATEGTKAPGNCKFTVTIDCVLLSGVIEIIPATDRAISGSGSGSSSGYSYGDGSGSGSGYGVEEFDGNKVYQIDGIQTVLHHIHGNVAKGAVLQNDLTLKPCYIVKGGGHFAHGETLRDAMTALTDKLFDDMPEDERIAAFVEAHPDYRKPYPNRDLYDWHHRLTGSCEMGRNAFVSDRGLSLDGKTTVEQFVELTKNAYGSSTIRKLPTSYGVE